MDESTLELDRNTSILTQGALVSAEWCFLCNAAARCREILSLLSWVALFCIHIHFYVCGEKSLYEQKPSDRAIPIAELS